MLKRLFARLPIRAGISPLVFSLLIFSAHAGAAAAAPVLKKRVAVLHLVNKTQWKDEKLGEWAAGMLQDKLGEDKGVAPISRASIEQALTDAKWKSASQDTAKAIELGRSLNANTVITGSVLDLEVTKTGDSARVMSVVEAAAADTATGEILHTRREQVSFNTNNPRIMGLSGAELGKDAAGELLAVVTGYLASNIAQALGQKAWTGLIVKTDKDYQMWINAGESAGAKKGFRFEVFHGTARKGVVRLAETLAEVSRAEVVEGGFMEVGDIARFVQADAPAARREDVKEAPSLPPAPVSRGVGSILQVDISSSKGVLKVFDGADMAKGAKLVILRDVSPAVEKDTGKIQPGGETAVGVAEVAEIRDGGLADIKILSGVRDISPGDRARARVFAPSGVTGRAAGYRNNEIRWSMSSEPEVKEYWIYRANAADGEFKVIGKNKKREETVYIDKHSAFGNPLEDSRTYYYRVSAVSTLDVESEPSASVGVATMGPPPPPPGISCESGLIRSVKIAWPVHEDKDVSGYRVYRAPASQGPFEMIREIKRRDETSHHDYGGGTASSPKLDDETTYYYAVSALSPYGDEGVKSAPLAAVTAPPPSVPTGFTAQSWRPGKVPLSWDVHRDEGVRGYLVYRSKEEAGPYAQIAEITGREKNSHIDGEGRLGLFSAADKLKEFTVYYYKIQAYNWAGSRSRMSEPISATTKPAPMAPEALKTTSNRPKQVPLTWRISPEVGLKEYRIFRSDSEIGEFKKIGEVPADKNYYLDTGLESERTYYYKIQAVDVNGMEGELSGVAPATTKKRPGAIHGLRWEREGQSVVLKWNASPEMDITEYLIYRKGFFGWQKTGATKETFYILEGFKTGDKADFTVSALDADGLEGDRSGVLTIDLR